MLENKRRILTKYFMIGIVALGIILLLGLICGRAYGTSATKVHFITAAQDNNIVLVESADRFGIIDSGEDDDYPYIPGRTGIIVGNGVEDKVIAYMRSVGVTKNNLDFYVGTHAHSDHIGSADTIISTFRPKRLYTPEYKDIYIAGFKKYGDTSRLWDNQYVYNNMIAAANMAGTQIITDFDDSNTVFQLGQAEIRLYNTDMSYRTSSEGVYDANLNSLGVKITSAEGKTAFIGADLSNFAGTESSVADQVGHVNISTVNHHGYEGSNSYKYVETLSADVLICGAKTMRASTNYDPGSYSYTPFNTLLSRMDRGTKIYSTGAYSKKVKALVFQLDENLTNNVPYGVYDTFDGSNYTRIKSRFMGMKDGNALIDGFKSGQDGRWINSFSNWYYKLNDGKYLEGVVLKIDGRLYCFYQNGKMFTGWDTVSGHTYYFGDSGAALTNRWLKSSGDWYWFDAYGAMVSNNWVNTGGKWYFMNPDGTMFKSGWKYINGKWYHFDAYGAMETDKWVISNGKWYLLGTDGKMMTNAWSYYSGYWFWVDENGVMASNGWKLINGQWYSFDKYGAMEHSRWKKSSGGKWYWLDGNGAMAADRWENIGGKWYWLDHNGIMASNCWKYINDKWYSFDQYGAMEYSHWKKNSAGNWCWLDGSGAMVKSSWKYSSGYTYWLDENGIMANTGWKEIGDKWYYFYDSGVMASNTVIDGYIIGSDGSRKEQEQLHAQEQQEQLQSE